MDPFVFGEDYVAAAALVYGGGSPYGCTTGPLCRYVDDCKFRDYTIPGQKTATVIAPYPPSISSIPIPSTTTDKHNFIYFVDRNRNTAGSSCQGFGLELAQLVLDGSPRRSSENKPHAIVIAISDGQDPCPSNKTPSERDKLIQNYNATVIQVGVGLSTCGDNFGKRFLMNLSSKVGNETAYFDVSDYAGAKSFIIRLLKPYNSDCVNCNGFCGCGICFKLPSSSGSSSSSESRSASSESSKHDSSHSTDRSDSTSKTSNHDSSVMVTDSATSTSSFMFLTTTMVIIFIIHTLHM